MTYFVPVVPARKVWTGDCILHWRCQWKQRKDLLSAGLIRLTISTLAHLLQITNGCVNVIYRQDYNVDVCIPKRYLYSIQVVCMGAEQNGLPSEYLRKLKAIQTNNYSGPSFLDQLTTKQ